MNRPFPFPGRAVPLMMGALLILGCHMSEAKTLFTNRSFEEVRSLRLAPCGVLVLGDRQPEPAHPIACLDAKDGHERWSVDYFLQPGSGVLAVSPDGGALYVGGDGTLHARRTADGGLLWDATKSKELTQNISHLTRPIVSGDLLLLAADSDRVFAIDRKDGHIAWRDRGQAADAIWVQEGVVVTVDNKTESANDLATGKELWRFTFAEGGHSESMDRVESSLRSLVPVAGVVPVIDLRAVLAVDVRSGKTVWRLPTAGFASLASNGMGWVIADDASVRGVDAKSGKVLWQHPSQGRTWAAPLTREEAFAHLPHSIATFDYATGREHEWFDEALVASAEVFAAKDGKVVMRRVEETDLFYTKDGRLHRADVGDHPGMQALLNSQYRDRAPVEVDIAGDLVAVRYKSGTVKLFEVE